MAGHIALPAGDVREPFIDIDDVADVVVAALTESGHDGEIYEVTGPRALSFGEVALELAEANGRTIEFVHLQRDAFVIELERVGLPREQIELLDYLFATVLDGRNTDVGDGVVRALGREPRDFAEWARKAAASGAWGSPAGVETDALQSEAL